MTIRQYHILRSVVRQGKLRQRLLPQLPFFFLLLAEGHAVGALILGRVHLMGTDQDLIQGAEVFVAAMVGALCDGTLDTFVGMAIHIKTSFDLGSDIVWAEQGKVFR